MWPNFEHQRNNKTRLMVAKDRIKGLGKSQSSTLKYLLVILLLTGPMTTYASVANAVASMDSHAATIDDSDRSNPMSKPGHPHDNQATACCHSVCVCCAAPSFLMTFRQVNGNQAVTSQSSREISGLLPNPHLKGLLRPPIFA